MASESALDKFLRLYQEHFEVPDTRAAVIVAGVAAAHYVPGEMIWLRVVGPSRSGKSELITSFLGHDDTTELEVLTPASLRGGFDGGHTVLPMIDGKLVVTKDLAAMLTTRSEVRTEVFGLFRNIKDGSLVSDFNTAKGGRRKQTAHFDWVIAITPAVHDYRSAENLLGARFVDVLMPPPNRLAMALRAAGNNAQLKAIRANLKLSASDLMSFARDEAKRRTVDLKPDEAELYAGWADLTALARSPVARDRNHILLAPPSPEVGTDLAQTLTRTAKGLMILGVSNVKLYIAKLAWDSIPPLRVDLITYLLDGGSVAKISASAGAMSYAKDDLLVLGLTKADSKGDERLDPGLEARFRVMASASKP